MKITPETCDVVPDNFDTNTKVLHEFSEIGLRKQEMTSLGIFSDVQAVCGGTVYIVQMSSGSLHLVIRDWNFNLVFCDHVISKHMKPITYCKGSAPEINQYESLCWPAYDRNNKLVVFHLYSCTYELNKIRECILNAAQLAGEVENERAASLNIPGETCPPLARPDSCLSTDVQSESTRTDLDLNGRSDVGADQSDVLSDERQQMQYKKSVVQSISNDLRDVTNEESDMEKMAVVLETHARQIKEFSERMDQKLSEGMEQILKLSKRKEQDFSERIEKLTRQVKQLQGQKKAANATVAKLEEVIERMEQEFSKKKEQKLSESMEQLTREIEQLQGKQKAANASVNKLEAFVDKYEAPVNHLYHPLLNMCKKHFTEEMQPAEVFQVLQFAQMIDSKHLKECCIRMLQDKTEDVLRADTWVDVSADFILTILQQDCLNVDSELTLLLACQRWAAHQPVGDQRQHLAQLLPYLRLRTLTAEDFMDFTLKHEIFSAQEKFQIMGCIAMPEMVMPEGLCNIGTPRTREGKMLIHKLSGEPISVMDLLPTECLFSSTATIISFIKDILLYGVRLQALPGSSANAAQNYNTTVNISIINRNKDSSVLYHTFEGKVKYGDYYDVHFPQPCLLRSKSAAYNFSIYYPDKVGRPQYQLFSDIYPDILKEGIYEMESATKLYYKVAC